MALRDLIRSVFVARFARIFAVSCGMAGLAGNFAAVTAVIQREGMFPQRGRAPGLVGVTVFATRAKESSVDGRFFMAGNTQRRCAAELIVLVAVLALQVVVFSIEGKYYLVVKAMQAVDPIMANQALCAVLLNVFIHKRCIVVAVTVLARLRVKRKLLPGMAGGAQQGRLVVIHGMHVERKFSETVVKCNVINFGRTPIKGRMTGCTVGAEHSCVTFGLFMAGGTVCFCISKGIRGVALFTYQGAVFTCQGKTGKGMVK